MTENKKQAKEMPEKAEIAVNEKKEAITKPSREPLVDSASPLEVWQAFDDTFSRFRNDFEDLLFPEKWAETFSFIPEIRVPVIDLEDRGKDYLLKAEMPGFKKENIEIEAQENSIAITGTAGWKYDEKGKLYICKERACKTFYRKIDLPEEIKIHEVEADLTEGVLEITLPKKSPKEKRKINLQ
ncbi:MAG: Hsp20/alpha crystallin family protein [Chloroflexota bacterium]|jgi:HSP20 family protein|nr:Hsp20/alpha crystallin family protein [Candidatus Sulfotelmatobacter sp.]